jgi:hypothetical protein
MATKLEEHKRKTILELVSWHADSKFEPKIPYEIKIVCTDLWKKLRFYNYSFMYLFIYLLIVL